MAVFPLPYRDQEASASNHSSQNTFLIFYINLNNLLFLDLLALWALFTDKRKSFGSIALLFLQEVFTSDTSMNSFDYMLISNCITLANILYSHLNDRLTYGYSLFFLNNFSFLEFIIIFFLSFPQTVYLLVICNYLLIYF